MPEVIGYTNAAGRDLFNRWFSRLDHQAAALVAGAIANMENNQNDIVRARSRWQDWKERYDAR